MDGVKFAQIIENELTSQKISKGDFYDAVGITATAMYGWKRGAEPKKETVVAVCDYLGINLADYETTNVLGTLREDLRILLRSAKDLPPSSVYELIAQIEKGKENAN